MSYSFGLRADSKDEAKFKVAAEVEKVVARYPIHGQDQAAILANANAVIDLARELKDNEEFAISVCGYIGSNDGGELGTVSISATASVAQKMPAQ